MKISVHCTNVKSHVKLGPTKEGALLKRKLTRDEIVDAAVRYADVHGIEQLSMRQLAGELNCGAMSIYHHVANKDDLVDLMIDAIAGEIEIPTDISTQDNWLEAMRALIISAYKMMLNHAWAPKYWGQGSGPAKNLYLENVLRLLRQAGFSEELSCRGFHALTMHVVGFSMQVLELRPLMDTKEKVHELGGRVLKEMSAEEFPFMVEHIHFHMAGKDQRNDFKYMLDLILDGLQRDYDSGVVPT